MRFRLSITIVCTMLLMSGCYFPMSGRVLDAETHQPIEGAVVLVEWTKTIGFGLTYTESYKVAETLSDKDGTFILPGCYSAFVNAPDVTVYKKGYVAWSSRWIFPSNENRKDFWWGNGCMFRLEKFKDTYSYVDHDGFISRSINDTIGWEEKKLIMKTYYDSEESLIIRERSERDKTRHGDPKQ